MSDSSVSYSDGTPCWADITLSELDAGRSFYGELLGWEFQAPVAEFGGYTEATSGGKAVAGLSPQPPGQEGGPAAWVVYFASSDARETATKVRQHGGYVLQGPMRVGDQGTMLLAKDPGGATFGVWQAGEHPGFGVVDEPGAYCWAEVVTREPEAADAFYPSVFPVRAQRMADPAEFDYVVWSVGERPVAGRFAMPESTSAQVPSHMLVNFVVRDCDQAVATVARLGGRVIDGPMDSPFGRFAVVTDQEGARFAVIDTAMRTGEPPQMQG